MTAQWSDNAFVAILKTPIPWVELGCRDFVFEHMPEDEDFRCLEWKGYSRLAILKASQKGIERIAQVLKDLPVAPGNKNHR
ncbi:MAG: hypothetical protein GXP29_05250 [Planctomycetes bacterium]|nr:hypothetical protein [Planctomycetota bacterium]